MASEREEALEPSTELADTIAAAMQKARDEIGATESQRIAFAYAEASMRSVLAALPTPDLGDDGELARKLTRKAKMFPATGGGSIGTDADGKTTSSSYITDDGMRLVNPDGPAAASRITELRAEVAELRAKLPNDDYCGIVVMDDDAN